MNLVAIGRSELMLATIRHLAKSGHTFSAIITHTAYSEYQAGVDDFERLAGRLGAAFFNTPKVTDEAVLAHLDANSADAAVSVNWQFVIPPSVLNRFQYGVLNYHIGNLPDFKGNATPNWSIISGLDHVYGNVHRMTESLDSGDVIAREKLHISNETYIADLWAAAEQHCPLTFAHALVRLQADPNHVEAPGSEDGLRCYPRLPEDSRIDWRQEADAIHRIIRASSRPYPGAFTFLDGKKAVIWRANVVRPANPYLAIPGHIVELDKASGSILVATGSELIEATELEVDGKAIANPGEFIGSIRKRFRDA
jgi:methionyl-tRNA formyltransferase